MAHNLEIRDGAASFVYVRRQGVALPWHELGEGVDNPLTVAEALRKSRASFEVETRPLYTRGMGDTMIAVPDMVATIRKDLNLALGVGSDGYAVVNYSEAFQAFYDAAFGENVPCVDTMGVLGQGERAFACALLDKGDVNGKGDVVQAYHLLTSSHDGTLALVSQDTETRVVCQNTLNIALSGDEGRVSIRHTKNVQARIDAACNALRKAREAFDRKLSVFRQLSDRQLSVAEFRTFLDTLLPVEGSEEKGKRVATRNRLTALFEGEGMGSNLAGRTAWGAFNAVTENVDRSARGEQPWLTSTLSLSAQKTRQTAFDTLVKLLV